MSEVCVSVRVHHEFLCVMVDVWFRIPGNMRADLVISYSYDQKQNLNLLKTAKSCICPF